jgi:hypothetical protein
MITAAPRPTSDEKADRPSTKLEELHREFSNIFMRSVLSSTFETGVVDSVNVLSQEHLYSFGERSDSDPYFNAKTDCVYYTIDGLNAKPWACCEVKRDARVGVADVNVSRQESAQVAAMI